MVICHIVNPRGLASLAQFKYSVTDPILDLKMKIETIKLKNRKRFNVANLH